MFMVKNQADTLSDKHDPSYRMFSKNRLEFYPTCEKLFDLSKYIGLQYCSTIMFVSPKYRKGS